jgi:hypothetical protein
MEYSEYRQKVIDMVLASDIKEFARENVLAFCDSEEDYIRRMYESDKEAVDSGRVNSFSSGISGTAFGLGMMYEG